MRWVSFAATTNRLDTVGQVFRVFFFQMPLPGLSVLNAECAIATVDHLLPELDRRYPGQSSDGTECREIDGVCYPTSQSGDVVVPSPGRSVRPAHDGPL